MKKYLLTGLLAGTFLCLQAQMTYAELAQIEEVNFVRTNPKAYAELFRIHAKNKVLDSMSVWIIHHELLPLLDTMAPLKPLMPSEALRRDAERFRGYDSINGSMWHDQSYYDNAPQWKQGGQNIAMAPVPRPRAQNMSMLIDACVKNRGHRVLFLHPGFTHISVRIIRLWGSEDKPFSSLHVVVYDMRSTEEGHVRFGNKDYPVSPDCIAAKPVKALTSELKNDNKTVHLHKK
jgi:hypothetical protein